MSLARAAAGVPTPLLALPRERVRPFLLGALALAALGAGGCHRTIRVLLVGDSITAGVVRGPEAAPFADRLGELLGDDYAVVDIAEAGSSAIDWVDWLEDRIPESAPPIAVILLGTNDAMGYLEEESVTADAYEQALRELIRTLARSGVERVVLMTPPRGTHDELPRLAAYRRRIFRICTTRPDVLCGPDLFSLLDRKLDFAPRVGGHGSDLHANASGHEKIAVALADTVRAAASEF